MSGGAGPGAPATTGLRVGTATAPGAGLGSWGYSIGQGWGVAGSPGLGVLGGDGEWSGLQGLAAGAGGGQGQLRERSVTVLVW